MRRREFIVGTGVSAALIRRAHAQGVPRPLIGYINSGTATAFAPFTTQWHLGLQSTGFIEGRNIEVEYHWTNGVIDRVPDITADLLRRRVGLLAVFGTASRPAIAAARSSSTVPIVFAHGVDPVAVGFVASLNRPGGRVTGITSMSFALVSKRVGLLHESIPPGTAIGFLTNSSNTDGDSEARDMQSAAEHVGRKLVQVSASHPGEIERAIERAKAAGAGALVIGTDTLFFGQSAALAKACLHLGMPAMGPLREFAAAGGLVSYGASIPDLYRQAGIYAGRVLRGEPPAELPVFQAMRFHIVINMKTAKALGIALSDKLLAIADEVIE